MAAVDKELRIKPLVMHGGGGSTGLAAYRGGTGVGGDLSVVINELSAIITDLDGEGRLREGMLLELLLSVRAYNVVQ